MLASAGNIHPGHGLRKKLSPYLGLPFICILLASLGRPQYIYCGGRGSQYSSTLRSGRLLRLIAAQDRNRRLDVGQFRSSLMEILVGDPCWGSLLGILSGDPY